MYSFWSKGSFGWYRFIEIKFLIYINNFDMSKYRSDNIIKFLWTIAFSFFIWISNFLHLSNFNASFHFSLSKSFQKFSVFLSLSIYQFYIGSSNFIMLSHLIKSIDLEIFFILIYILIFNKISFVIFIIFYKFIWFSIFIGILWFKNIICLHLLFFCKWNNLWLKEYFII